MSSTNTSMTSSKVKTESDRCENSNMSSDDNSTRDSTYQKLSFVENQELLRQILRKGIYLEAMRDFISNVKEYADNIPPEEELDLLLLAVSCIDLTTLSGDDTLSNVERLCYRSIHAINGLSSAEDEDNRCIGTTCAAVCVYPARIVDCLLTFKRLDCRTVNIASVATGFPSGQYSLSTRLDEIKGCVELGAHEIDVVINRAAALTGNWPLVFEELCEMRKACDIRLDEGHRVHMKVIIAAGDLLTSSPNNIFTASFVSILAGADFIKTSTGKEPVNATLPIGYIMMRAIIDYHDLTDLKIGFKAAGGIRTYKDALKWLVMVKMMLGPKWLNKGLFRFGASGLLDDVERRIIQLKRQQHTANQ